MRKAGEASDVGRALAVGGLLHHHAGQFRQGLGQRAHQLFFQILLTQHLDLQRHGVGIEARAGGGDDDFRRYHWRGVARCRGWCLMLRGFCGAGCEAGHRDSGGNGGAVERTRGSHRGRWI